MNAQRRGRVSVVILTTGNRRDQLTAAVGSALDQSGVDVEVVVVANGVPGSALGLLADDRVRVVRVVESEHNVGIPGGRNLGFEHTTGPVVAFLDDDARILDRRVLARCVQRFDASPATGAIALRLVDEDGVTMRRHVPRIGARRPDRSGPVTAFLGGAVVVRRTAFDDAGRYAGEFQYSMEETDLALRLVDRGWQILYDGRPAVYHPATLPGRHADALSRTMRNRVWLADRNLPLPIGVAYVAIWFAISLARNPTCAGALGRSTISAWRTRPGPRIPIRWRTVLTLTRLGRPPVI